MKNNLLRLAYVFLALSICVTAIACAKNEGGKTDTTLAAESLTDSPASESTTSDIYDESGYIRDNIPETVNLGDNEITILYWSDVRNQEFFSEGSTGEAINDSIYERNLAVEDRLKVKLKYTGVLGNYDNQSLYIQEITTTTMSGTPYDIYAGYSMSIASVAYKGYAANLNEFNENIDFDMPWWPDSLLSESVINNKLYFVSGDISTNFLHSMYACFFNKDMISKYNLEDPYGLALDGKWTLDKLIGMSTNIYSDLDGSNTKTVNDQFGFSTNTVHLDGFFTGSGLRTTDKDANGVLIVSESFGSEKTIDLVNKVCTFLHSTNDAYTAVDSSSAKSANNAFIEGRALFTYNFAEYAIKYLASTEVKYGILPLPKYDELQSDYSTLMGFPVTLYSLPNGGSKLTEAAYVLECLASESYRRVTPAVFELSMKVKYANDETTAQIYNIIRESAVFDVGRIFTMNLGGGITYSFVRNTLSQNTAANYKSGYNTIKKQLSTYLVKLSETLG